MLKEYQKRELTDWAVGLAEFLGESGDLERPEGETSIKLVSYAFEEQMKNYVVNSIKKNGLDAFFDWDELDGGQQQETITDEAIAFLEDVSFSDSACFYADLYIQIALYGNRY